MEQDTIMATKQIIVAICLLAVVMLAEARSTIKKTAKAPGGRTALYNKGITPEAKRDIELKAVNPDTDLTTVSFILLMIKNVGNR
jgi:hypothetical protein